MEVITISANQFLVTLVLAASSYGVMLATVIGLKKDLKDHVEREERLLGNYEGRLMDLERKETARAAVEAQRRN